MGKLLKTNIILSNKSFNNIKLKKFKYLIPQIDNKKYIKLKNKRFFYLPTIFNAFLLFGGLTTFASHATIMIGETQQNGTIVSLVVNGVEAQGKEAIAIGKNAKANGDYSVVLGTEAEANGNDTLIWGYQAGKGLKNPLPLPESTEVFYGRTSLGDLRGLHTYFVNKSGFVVYGNRIGIENLATHTNIVIGKNSANDGLGMRNVAIGNATATQHYGIDSVSIGTNANNFRKHGSYDGIQKDLPTFAKETVAIGKDAMAYGNNAVVIGSNATTSPTPYNTTGGIYYTLPNNAIAIGNQSSATDQNSIAVGYSAISQRVNSIAIGAGTKILLNSQASIFQPTNSGNNLAIGINTMIGELPGSYNTVIGSENKIIGGGNQNSLVGYKSIIANAKNSLALGNNLVVALETRNNVVMGLNSQANGGRNSIAIGVHSYTTNLTSGGTESNTQVAIGSGVITYGTGTTALGTGAVALGRSGNNLVISANSPSYTNDGQDFIPTAAQSSIIFGDNNVAIGNRNLVGDNNDWTKNNIVLGNDIKLASDNVKVTREEIKQTIEGQEVTTYFYKPDFSSNESWKGVVKSVAIGHDLNLKGRENIVLGNNINILANGETSAIVGYNSQVSAANTFVLGNNIIADVNNSIYLGANSQATKGNKVGTKVQKLGFDEDKNKIKLDGETTTAGDTGQVLSFYLNGTEYRKTFAAAKANGVVTLGQAGAERRIQNVAAGEISATSTDAVNGSQLFVIANTLAEQISNISTSINIDAGKNIVITSPDNSNNTRNNNGSSTNSKNEYVINANSSSVQSGKSGNLDVVSVITKDKDGVENVEYTVDTKSTVKFGDVVINPEGNGKITGVADGDISATSTDVINGRQLHVTNQKISQGLNFAADQGAVVNRQLGDTVNIIGDANITTKTTSDGVQINLNRNINVDTITAGNTQISSEGLKITVGGVQPYL